MFKKIVYKDEDMKMLVLYIKNSNNTISLPMPWKDMKEFIKKSLIPYLANFKGGLRLFSTKSAYEGIPDDFPIAFIMFEEIAGYKIFDVSDDEDSNDKTTELLERHVKVQEKVSKILEKSIDEGEEWKKQKEECKHENIFEDPEDNSVKCLDCKKKKRLNYYTSEVGWE